jgi:hypothetical protein
MLRQRTLSRGGNPGQPYAAVTDPRRIKPAKPEKRKRCGECFGPRSRYQSGLFCSRCEVELFGDRRLGYIHFIRSERARNVQRARRRAAA